jgi:mannose-6-phosphate isomerase-like protein (cupin superfamily)
VRDRDVFGIAGQVGRDIPRTAHTAVLHHSEPHRPGSRELLTIQTGTVALDVGDHHAEIPAGDSAWFDATWPHAYANPAAAAATFTLVVLEPA